MTDYAPSSSLLIYATWVAVSLFVVVAALLVVSVLVRIGVLFKEKNKNKFLQQWEPIIEQSFGPKATTALPELNPNDAILLLMLWNYFHAVLRGKSKAKLNEFAYATDLPNYAEKLLKSPSAQDRLVAIMSLGHLGKKTYWQTLRELAMEEDPVLSLAAARALVQIDAVSAMRFLAKLIVHRIDWSPSKVALLLKEAGADAVSERLREEISNAPTDKLAHSIGYLKFAHSYTALPVIRKFLKMDAPEQVIIACLDVLAGFKNPEEMPDLGDFLEHSTWKARAQTVHALAPDDLPLVRMFISHPSWRVRAEAAKTLGQVGVQEDKELLIRLLQDPEPWVRYYAAQALGTLPFVESRELETISQNQQDPHTASVLKQVMEEKKVYGEVA